MDLGRVVTGRFVLSEGARASIRASRASLHDQLGCWRGKGLQPKVDAQAPRRAWLADTLGGKHNIKMVKDGEERPITLPMHKGRDYSRGLTASILKQAGVS
jgi:hypothetical protein